jgi:prepilin-type N-terminal cleavage/methylation domain-containing protein
MNLFIIFINKDKRFGFSLIELLISITIVGIVIFPIFSVFRTGKQGTIQNRDYFMAYNLARSRMEELKVLPFNKLTSDFDLFAGIYSDSLMEEFADMDVNEELFKKNFTDIYTEASSKKYSDIYEKFCSRYTEYYGKAYELYSDEYSNFKRITYVSSYKEYGDSLKKVRVEIRHPRSDKPLAEIVSLMGEE